MIRPGHFNSTKISWRKVILLILGYVLAGRTQTTAISESSGIQSRLEAANWTGAQWAVSGDSGRVLLSSDGRTWLPCSTGTLADLSFLTTSGSSMVAAGALSQRSFSSVDGKVWASSPVDSSYGQVNSLFWSGRNYLVFFATPSTCHGNETLEVCSTPSPPIGYSPDGQNWVYRAFPDSGSQVISSAVVDGKVFALSNLVNGRILTSNDDTNWSVLATPSLYNAKSVIWSGTHLIAVGTGGWIGISSDGISWNNPANRASYQNLNALAHASGWTLAAGDAGTIYASRDDSDWTPIFSGTKRNLRGLAANDSLFVAVGDSGTILRIPVTSLAAAGIQSRTKQLSHALISIQANQIEITSPIIVGASPYSIQITGLDGRIRWERHALTSENGSAISLPRFPSGAYLLSLQGKGLRESQIFTLP